jgi:preprotein translocase subunit YajC
MKRQKNHRNMVAALAKGDEVITSGGVLGKVTKVTDHYVTVEIGAVSDKPVEAVLQKAAVTSVLPKGTIKAL